MQARI
ncbi:unnamed protein product [Linum tenue]|jgi:hypothetical protein